MRETGSGKEVVDGSWRRTRYYRTEMRVGAIEMGRTMSWSKVFLCIFVESMGLKKMFSEEKKIRENRIDEREKREGVDRDRERRKR